LCLSHKRREATGGALPTTRQNEVLREVLTALAEDAAVLDELVLAARSNSPDVARLPEVETRRHIQLLLAVVLGAEGLQDHPDEQALSFAAALGADRAAQGVPLTSLLRGFQAARAHAAQLIIARCHDAGLPADFILERAVRTDRYTDAVELHIVTGYCEAEQKLSRTSHDLRIQLLRSILLPGDAGLPAREQLVQAGLQPESRYHCVVGDITDPAQARDVEQHLCATGGIYGLVDGRFSGVTRRPPDDAADTLLIVAPPAPLHTLGEIHHLCVSALRVAAQEGRRGTHHLTDLAGDIAMAAQPVLGDLLAGTLSGLDPAEDFHRELAGTALAYLHHGQRIGHTATALHLHPNTVRYRLDRLAQITALPLNENPAECLTMPVVIRIWWALRTWLAQAGHT
jgi:hypothetical protein